MNLPKIVFRSLDSLLFFSKEKPASLEKSWSRHVVTYQIYPRSFNDSNGDGVGDLQGIIDRLDYLNDGTEHSLGVGAIWLSPFYPSPMKDMGYDISDYYNVDPLFGTLADFEKLIEEAHKRNIKVIIDFVANHTSDEHPWFVESKSSKTNPKADWYIWKNPKKDGSAPNNWLSVFGGSAWEYVPERKQYYLHSFLTGQPDLNWRNPEVRKELYNVLTFWLKKGVDGFRVDAANHILKDERFLDEPVNPEYVEGTTKPWYRYMHPYMRNLSELPEVIFKPMAEFVATFGDKLLITEANLTPPDLQPIYSAVTNHRLTPFNFNLMRQKWDAQAIKSCVEAVERILSPEDLPNWVLGNHDRSRLATRIGEEQTRIAAMLLLTLRGMPFIYNGDEIGMVDGKINPEDIQDNFEKNEPGLGLGRDPERTPLQWNKKKYAGFSTVKPWLPVSENYSTHNIFTQSFEPQSLLSLYRQLIHLRHSSPALRRGIYQTIPTSSLHVYAYKRLLGHEDLIIVLNFSGRDLHVVLEDSPETGRLVLTTLLDRPQHTYLNLKSLHLRGHEGMIIRINGEK